MVKDIINHLMMIVTKITGTERHKLLLIMKTMMVVISRSLITGMGHLLITIIMNLMVIMLKLNMSLITGMGQHRLLLITIIMNLMVMMLKLNMSLITGMGRHKLLPARLSMKKNARLFRKFFMTL